MTITLDRPQVLNAIDQAMHDALQNAFDRFEADASLRICIVTGTGDRAFCVGSDLSAGVPTYPRNGYAGLTERFSIAKPLIAAVNGLCLGGGLEVALACDMIVAVDDARFGLPEPRVGAVALAGGLHRLARQIGLKRAMGAILTGKPFSAIEALQWGLINAAVPRAELAITVDRLCEEILQNAPLAVSASKETVMRGLDECSVTAAMQAQKHYPAFDAWSLGKEDQQEGGRAFLEKRSPVWRGR